MPDSPMPASWSNLSQDLVQEVLYFCPLATLRALSVVSKADAASAEAAWHTKADEFGGGWFAALAGGDTSTRVETYPFRRARSDWPALDDGHGPKIALRSGRLAVAAGSVQSPTSSPLSPGYSSWAGVPLYHRGSVQVGEPSHPPVNLPYPAHLLPETSRSGSVFTCNAIALSDTRLALSLLDEDSCVDGATFVWDLTPEPSAEPSRVLDFDAVCRLEWLGDFLLRTPQTHPDVAVLVDPDDHKERACHIFMTPDDATGDVILLSAADDFFVASAAGHASVSVFLSPTYAHDTSARARRAASTVLVPWQAQPVTGGSAPQLPRAGPAEIEIEILSISASMTPNAAHQSVGQSAGPGRTHEMRFEMLEHPVSGPSGLPLDSPPTALSAAREHFAVLDAMGGVALWRVAPDALVKVACLPPLPGPRCPPHMAEIVLDFKESGAPVVAMKSPSGVPNSSSRAPAPSASSASSASSAPPASPASSTSSASANLPSSNAAAAAYGRPRRLDDALILRDFETTEDTPRRRHVVATPFGDDEMHLIQLQQHGGGMPSSYGALSGSAAASASQAGGSAPQQAGSHSVRQSFGAQPYGAHARSTKKIHTLHMHKGQVVCCVEDSKGKQAAIAVATAKPPLSACTVAH